MKIVFMGTPDFSVPCLKALCKSGHNVAAVYTQPDKPKGRGYKMIPTPVKKCAEEFNIPVYQPKSLRKGEDAEKAVENLGEIAPDLIIVVAVSYRNLTLPTRELVSILWLAASS